MRVGVLALQGAFREHIATLARLGVESREVRTVKDLEGVEGLILPGGESTTIGMLMDEYGLIEALRQGEMPLFGTCAGMIVLAKDIQGSTQPRLGLMDMAVDRNHYGRQRESFETEIAVTGLPQGVRGVFIRAPVVTRTGSGVEILARHQGEVVLCAEGRCLAAAFHPELTDDTRLHRMFLDRFVEKVPARRR
ncbi:MAG: pyridoxal 5'-phosphate synthase glutaminase subunit PdxT [Sulfobacillus sp.]